MRFAVGARFACLHCLTRGFAPTCARCKREAIDLSKRALDDWPLWKAHLARRPIFSPAVLRSSKLIKRLAAVLTVLNVVPAFVMAFVKDSGSAPLGAALLGVTIGVLIFAPLTWLFYCGFLFIAALTFHFMAMALEGLREVLPLGEPRLRIVALIARVIARPFLRQLRLVEVEPPRSEAPLRGVLAAPLVVDSVTDRLAVMQRADAVLAGPLLIRFDGAATDERVELAAGELRCAQPGVPRSAAPELTSWLQPVRDGTARRFELQAGTRVVLRRAPGFVQLEVN